MQKTPVSFIHARNSFEKKLLTKNQDGRLYFVVFGK